MERRMSGPFREEDLERLKQSSTVDVPHYLSTDLLKALLSRLEASEKIASRIPQMFDVHPTRDFSQPPNSVHLLAEDYWAWRKTCGR